MYGTVADMIDLYLSEFLWRQYVKNRNLVAFETILKHTGKFQCKVLSEM